VRYFSVFFFVLVWLPQPSYGYIDPGSGHLIWQALLSGLFGGFFFLKKFITFPRFKRSRVPQEKK